MAANNTQNVSTTKGIKGGYLFSAPRNATTLAFILTLSDFSVQLTEAFKNLGFVSSDGIVEGESVDTNTDTDMNGDAINTSRSNRVETEKFRLVERKKDSLAEQHGHSNVTDEGGLITVHHNNDEREHRIYVAELVLKDGRRFRKIVPDGQVTEVADLTLSSTELDGREVTVTCNSYTYTLNGVTYTDTVIDFIQSTETPAPTLSAISLSNVTLTTPSAFASGTTSYAGTATGTSTTVTVTKVDSNDTVAITDANGNEYASGGSVPIVTGTNVITVKVADDQTGNSNSYVFTLTKSA